MEGNISLPRLQSLVILPIHMEYLAQQGAVLKHAERLRMPNWQLLQEPALWSWQAFGMLQGK